MLLLSQCKGRVAREQIRLPSLSVVLLAMNGLTCVVQLTFQAAMFDRADVSAGHAVTRLMVADASVAQAHTIGFAAGEGTTSHALPNTRILLFQARIDAVRMRGCRLREGGKRHDRHKRDGRKAGYTTGYV